MIKLSKSQSKKRARLQLLEIKTGQWPKCISNKSIHKEWSLPYALYFNLRPGSQFVIVQNCPWPCDQTQKIAWPCDHAHSWLWPRRPLNRSSKVANASLKVILHNYCSVKEAQDGVTSKIFVCSFESCVAGIKFYDGLHHLQPMMLVQLRRERNSFDTNAVAVYIKGEELGHLERNAAAALFCLDSKLPD